MKSYLQSFQELRSYLATFIFNRHEDTLDLYDMIQGGIQVMHSKIVEHMLSTKDDAILKRYMHVLQEELSRTIDSIPLSWIEGLDPFEQPSPDSPTAKQNLICLDGYQTIKNLQRQYPTYFNLDSKPPLIYAEIEKCIHQHKFMMITHWMEQKGYDQEECWQIINMQMQKILQQGAPQCSFREHDYTWHLLDHLHFQINNYGDQITIDKLFILLIYNNYNSPNFVGLVTNTIQEAVDAILLPSEKIKFMMSTRDRMSSLLVRKDLSFDPGHPPINIMLNRWIRCQLEDFQTP